MKEVAGMSVGRPEATRASGHSGRATGTGGSEPTIPATADPGTAAPLRQTGGKRSYEPDPKPAGKKKPKPKKGK